MVEIFNKSLRDFGVSSTFPAKKIQAAATVFGILMLIKRHEFKKTHMQVGAARVHRVSRVETVTEHNCGRDRKLWAVVVRKSQYMDRTAYTFKRMPTSLRNSQYFHRNVRSPFARMVPERLPVIWSTARRNVLVTPV